MKLGKLLGAGKSFFGGKQAMSYRLNHLSLPKFNEGKNPFGAKLVVESKAAAPAPRVEKSADPAKPVASPFGAPVAATAKASVSAVADKPRQGWTTRLNPFRPPAPPPQPRAVQAELSLDAVKVVHNDLSDADVDVVPMKSSANAPVAAPVLPPARRAWEYLGERVVNS